jgi:glycosyltransferase involved in cell wall biosynthesis
VRKMRIAFLTNEFVIETPSGGGLGNYLNRISRALKQLGHHPEIFTIRRLQDTPAVVDFDGVRVEHVDVPYGFASRMVRRVESRFLRSPWVGSSGYIRNALALSQALERRHAEAPFAFVQSTNAGASGLFVRKRIDRPHLIRLSSHCALWFEADGQSSVGARLMAGLERMCLRRADIAYAPSRFVADYCRLGWRKDVWVVRPPVLREVSPQAHAPLTLPDRYLIHFGRIGSRKGSDVLAAALNLVWQQAPDFKMIWAGKAIKLGEYEKCHQQWGKFAGNLIWLGEVEKPLLYAILRRAQASVLPSRVDNFPNTVIESLMFGVPVIGSKGASIDELVEHGVNGELVSIGDKEALATAMLKVWRGEATWTGQGFQRPKILDECEPSVAASNLLKLAGFADQAVKV